MIGPWGESRLVCVWLALYAPCCNRASLSASIYFFSCKLVLKPKEFVCCWGQSSIKLRCMFLRNRKYSPVCAWHRRYLLPISTFFDRINAYFDSVAEPIMTTDRQIKAMCRTSLFDSIVKHAVSKASWISPACRVPLTTCRPAAIEQSRCKLSYCCLL